MSLSATGILGGKSTAHAEELVFFYFIVDFMHNFMSAEFFLVFFLQLHIFKSHFQFL